MAKAYPEVDSFAEISDYKRLAGNVRAMVAGESFEAYVGADGLRAAEREGARLLATPSSYAYLRISHGCDHSCGFCAIPSIRGPHRSKPLEAVRSEAQELIAAGVRELVLVAEDSTAWGREMGLELPDLVEALAELPGEHVVRVMYAYPNRFPWRLCELLAEHPRVRNYLDIPIQHASTAMLRAMGRAGSGEVVRRTLDKLREHSPAITLRSTVLLGYPGETEADVEELAELIETYRLGRLGGFTYSPEQGTSGFELSERVPADVAQRRLDRILRVRDRVLEAEQRSLLGHSLEVLVDEAATAPESAAVGRSEMDAPEVDPLVLIEGRDRAQWQAVAELEAGRRLKVEVFDLDEDLNLRGFPIL